MKILPISALCALVRTFSLESLALGTQCRGSHSKEVKPANTSFLRGRPSESLKVAVTGSKA